MDLIISNTKTIKGKKKHEMKHNEHDHTDHHRMMAEDFKKRFIITLPVTIVVLLLSTQIQKWFGFSINFVGREFVLFVLGSVIAFYGGKPFFTAAKKELATRNWGMMTLVTLAVLSGYTFSVAATFLFPGESLWWEISTLVLAFLFGHWVEMKAVLGTGGALKELAELIPPEAHRIVGKDIKDIKTHELRKGDLVLVKPGEKIPADGLVVEGESSVNEAMITGESKPQERKKGDEVIGGTINQNGSLTIKVTKTGEESALSQIRNLISRAQETKPAVQNLADKAANWLTIIAIVIGSGTFIYWMFINPAGAVTAVTFAITVIVITCPHALGLAIPTVATITSSLAAKNGILIRDMKGLEVARKLDYVVFDKTGTLTEGVFEVQNFEFMENIKTADKSLKWHKSKNLLFKDYVRALILSLEIRSSHPVARQVEIYLKKKDLLAFKVSEFKNHAGRGISGMVDGHSVVIGTQTLLRDQHVIFCADLDSKTKQWVNSGQTVAYVSIDGKHLVSVGLSDTIKPESGKAVKELRDLGVNVAMLTGDNRKTAQKVAKQLKINKVFAEVLPEDKIKKVKELQNEGFTVAMVGDGVNDAPSLTQAHVGIAIGAGTSVAIESAEIVLVKDNPLDVVKIINLSRKTDLKMKQNLAWATGYNLLAIPAAAGVFSSFGLILRPEWGALLMSASSIIVVANALRLKSLKL